MQQKNPYYYLKQNSWKDIQKKNLSENLASFNIFLLILMKPGFHPLIQQQI